MALRILCIKSHSHSLKYHESQTILELIWTSKVLTTQVTKTVHHYIPGTDRSQGKNKKTPTPQNKTHIHTYRKRGREHGENRKERRKKRWRKTATPETPWLKNVSGQILFWFTLTEYWQYEPVLKITKLKFTICAILLEKVKRATISILVLVCILHMDLASILCDEAIARQIRTGHLLFIRPSASLHSLQK